ncbi:ubiquitin family protein [Pseudohyphozyma bogoriensis]|nr:ubiquitin family protein [Pseudohyphozyma bogoriensis]
MACIVLTRCPSLNPDQQKSSVLILRPPTLAAAIERAYALFPLISRTTHQIFLTADLPHGLRNVKITEEVWNSSLLRRVEPTEFEVQTRSKVAPGQAFEDQGMPSLLSMFLDNARGKKRAASPGSPASSSHASDDDEDALALERATRRARLAALPNSDRVRLIVRRDGSVQHPLELGVRRSTELSRVSAAYFASRGGRPEGVRVCFYHEGVRYGETQFVADFLDDDMDTAEISILWDQVGGKPVIYLFPPTALPSVDVSLSLCPSWTFSALYPLSPITKTKDRRSTTSWTVSAAPNGDLVELSSATSLTYLFWEAHTTHLPPSPPLLPSDHPLSPPPSFNPSTATLTPTNSILLPFASLIPYLDATLKLLTLHTSARNDFITYWLPSFVRISEKGRRIAMRFVEQEAYEDAARLEISPKPDVVTRVFMLFRGIGQEGTENKEWQQAEKRVGELDWREVIGLKEDAWDTGKFRALE